MTLQNMLIIIGVSSIALITSGCVETFRLIRSETPQANPMPRYNYDEIIERNVRSLTIYDQFRTVAMFDALWMSVEVRQAYVDMIAVHKAKDVQARNALLRRELEENKHWVTLYVLAEIANKTHDLLSEQSPYWHLRLKFADGETVAPISIKVVELEPEIEFFFGTKLTPYKVPYLITFPVSKKSEGGVEHEKNHFTLLYNSPDLAGSVSWNAPLYQEKKAYDVTASYIKTQNPKDKKKLRNEDFYWS